DKQNRVLKSLVGGADLLVDALFGTGTRLPIKDDAAKLLRAVNGVIEERKKKSQREQMVIPTLPYASPEDRLMVIAVDCPSGLDCDTGETDPLTLKADITITFAAAKPGQLTFPGADFVGTLYIADIGLPEKLDEFNTVQLELSDLKTVVDILPPRTANSHKGTFGKTFIVAGSLNYVGAAYLEGSAAYRVGAGLVTLAVPQAVMGAVASRLPEATWVLLPSNMGLVNEAAAKIVREEIGGYKALLVGPGLGHEEDTQEFMAELFSPKEKAKKHRIGLLQLDTEAVAETEANSLPPMVIDADGLNILAQIDSWWELLPQNTIITPHPLEFARLAKIEEKDTVQANRVMLAQQKAAEWKTIVVLKGAFT
ncbi:MAG: bifunctional ADP-dependent NAD(P)H-hydrate dehydratase/NAD(P)H-hydrate epimerase, partial [Anaerolineae bacterium]|nr:bifunctional ADP-dependent NAD(P)H-hydrate dehydratase/NAD(P)H-hydrate epimerase [Anaerolineae bacterium]